MIVKFQVDIKEEEEKTIPLPDKIVDLIPDRLPDPVIPEISEPDKNNINLDLDDADYVPTIDDDFPPMDDDSSSSDDEFGDKIKDDKKVGNLNCLTSLYGHNNVC